MNPFLNRNGTQSGVEKMKIVTVRRFIVQGSRLTVDDELFPYKKCSA